MGLAVFLFGLSLSNTAMVVFEIIAIATRQIDNPAAGILLAAWAFVQCFIIALCFVGGAVSLSQSIIESSRECADD